MASGGETIENPGTGERITFLDVAADTRGELLRFDLRMPPGIGVPMAHYHPRQEERFELVSGSARFRIGGKTRTAHAGDTLTVPPGVRHRFRNDGHDELHVVVSFRPALRTESFFEGLWAGRLTRRGMPHPGTLIHMAPQNYLEEVVVAGIPLPVQRALQRVLALFARRSAP